MKYHNHGIEWEDIFPDEACPFDFDALDEDTPLEDHFAECTKLFGPEFEAMQRKRLTNSDDEADDPMIAHDLFGSDDE